MIKDVLNHNFSAVDKPLLALQFLKIPVEDDAPLVL